MLVFCIFNQLHTRLRLALVSLCIIVQPFWVPVRFHNDSLSTPQKPFFSCICHGRVGLWPAQLVIFFSLCWCCLWSLPPMASPASFCHTQLFHSSISPCPPLVCLISTLSRHSLLISLSLTPSYLFPAFTVSCLALICLFAALCAFICCHLTHQHPVSLCLSPGRKMGGFGVDFSLYTNWLSAWCRHTYRYIQTHSCRLTFSPSNVIKLVVKTLKYDVVIVCVIFCMRDNVCNYHGEWNV